MSIATIDSPLASKRSRMRPTIWRRTASGLMRTSVRWLTRTLLSGAPAALGAAYRPAVGTPESRWQSVQTRLACAHHAGRSKMPTSLRWPVPHVLAVACGALLFGAVFVLCGGISMGRSAVIGLGVGLIAVGVGLAILAARSGRSSHVVLGIGHVLDRTVPPVNVEFGRCKLHLAISARGMRTTSVRVRAPRVPIDKWPDLNANLPVLVSTARPLRVRVLWNRVPTHEQTAPIRPPADVTPKPTSAMRVIYLDI